MNRTVLHSSRTSEPEPTVQIGCLEKVGLRSRMGLPVDADLARFCREAWGFVASDAIPAFQGKLSPPKLHAGFRAVRSELHFAVLDRNFERVKELVRQGMNLNLGDRDGWTPLHAAAQNNEDGDRSFSSRFGCNVDPRDSCGNTPLFRAVFNSRGDGELIELLRERGADAEPKNKSGASPVGLPDLLGLRHCPIVQRLGRGVENHTGQ